MATKAIGFGTKRMKDGSPWHVCGACHYEWPDTRRYLRWPIRVKSNHPFGRKDRPIVRRWYWPPTQWGVEVGSDALWRRTFTRVVGIGSVRVILGHNARMPQRDIHACPRCGAAAWQRPGVEGAEPARVPRWELWRIEAIWRLRYSRESYEAMNQSFNNVYRLYADTEEAVRVVTDASTALAVHQLVRRKEAAAVEKEGA